MGKGDDAGPVQAAYTWEERRDDFKEFWNFEKWGLNKDRKYQLPPPPRIESNPSWRDGTRMKAWDCW